MEFRGRIPRAFVKTGIHVQGLKMHGLLEYTYEKGLCVDSMSEIEFNAVSNSC